MNALVSRKVASSLLPTGSSVSLRNGQQIRTLVVPYVPVSRRRMYREKNKSWHKRLRKTRAGYSKPTLAQAHAMPVSFSEMDNDVLVSLGAMQVHEARKEILKRHIMHTDHVDYEEAERVFAKIQTKNKEGMWLLAAPYQLGIIMAMSSGMLALPMVFDLSTAQWFNEYYVTTDVPEPKDLETMLEVGSWTWNWMEPPLGTISFVLLALQFTRAQIQNLGAKPYTEAVKHWRGRRLALAFPQYDANLLIYYSESSSLAV